MTLWETVYRRKESEGCRCPIRRDMTYRELVDLESGCRGTKAGGPGWVCEVLDFYRTKTKAAEDAVARRNERKGE